MQKLFYKYRQVLLVILVILSASVIRFYNFENRINFGPEQARSLIVAGNNIIDKWSLLGQELFRVTKDGHILFSSALFSYSLVPLLLVFNYNPISVTAFFALLNLLTGVILFFVVKKITNFNIAFFAMILFLFSYLMVYHSMFIWIANYLPLVGVVTLYFISLIVGKPKQNIKYLLDVFLLGVISGIGIGLEYAYILTVMLIGVYLLWKTKFNIVNLLLFSFGTIIGTFPIFIFDIKHNFYHLTTLLSFLTEGRGEVGFVYYHYLHFIVVLAVLGGFIIDKIYRKNEALKVNNPQFLSKKTLLFDRFIGGLITTRFSRSANKYAVVLIILFYIAVNLTSSQISFTKAIGMSDNFNVKSWFEAADLIAHDKPNRFNVAALLDYDSQAHPLRYLLEFSHGLTPQPVEQYYNPDYLYVIAEKNYNFDQAIAWEINAYRPFRVVDLVDLKGGYSVYKLKKMITGADLRMKLNR